MDAHIWNALCQTFYDETSLQKFISHLNIWIFQFFKVKHKKLRLSFLRHRQTTDQLSDLWQTKLRNDAF